MKFDRYLYIVEIDTDQIKAVLSADHVGDAAEMAEFVRDVRRRFGVDDYEAGLDLRDSAERPLSAKVLAQLAWRRDR